MNRPAQHLPIVLAALLLGVPACDSTEQSPLPPAPTGGRFGEDGRTDAAVHDHDAPDSSGQPVEDRRSMACADPDWTPGPCVEGVGEHRDNQGQAHIAVDQPIAYAFDPPSSGDHRGVWARWGAYEDLPPQRFLHNLEHGGAALLHHPCAPAETVQALRDVADARDDDAGGPFRWVLTPYPDLPQAIAVVTWEWTYTADCVRPDEIAEFLDRHYRMAPEDIASDGGYAEGWLGR